MQVKEYQIPEGLFYDRNNYWIKMSKSEALIGLTEYGQSTIGDILYLETVPVGTTITREEEVGSIEAGKWVGKLVAPVSGMVIETNKNVQINPRELNQDPYGQAWIYRVKLNDFSEKDMLMDSVNYARWVEEQIRLEDEEELSYE